jgi:hypothetical protein
MGISGNALFHVKQSMRMKHVVPRETNSACRLL